MHIALYQPDIAQNVGAIMRLCACFDTPLHIIEPCGFAFDLKKIRQAGMDYIEHVTLRRYVNFEEFLENRPSGRLILLSTKSEQTIDQFNFEADDCLIFGRESAGVTEEVVKAVDVRIKIPMKAGMRSLNVAQSAAIALAESLRQQGWNL